MSVFSTDAVAIIVEGGPNTSASDASIVVKHVTFFTGTFVIGI